MGGGGFSRPKVRDPVTGRRVRKNTLNQWKRARSRARGRANQESNRVRSFANSQRNALTGLGASIFDAPDSIQESAQAARSVYDTINDRSFRNRFGAHGATYNVNLRPYYNVRNRANSLTRDIQGTLNERRSRLDDLFGTASGLATDVGNASFTAEDSLNDYLTNAREGLTNAERFGNYADNRALGVFGDAIGQAESKLNRLGNEREETRGAFGNFAESLDQRPFFTPDDFDSYLEDSFDPIQERAEFLGDDTLQDDIGAFGSKLFNKRQTVQSQANNRQANQAAEQARAKGTQGPRMGSPLAGFASTPRTASDQELSSSIGGGGGGKKRREFGAGVFGRQLRG